MQIEYTESLVNTSLLSNGNKKCGKKKCLLHALQVVQNKVYAIGH